MIRLEDLWLRAGAFELRLPRLEIDEGEYFVLLGPTGSGKTVLLETIAGLRQPHGGSVWLDGINVTTWAPERRRVGFVYQDYLLFPHLTVSHNIAFGLRGAPADERRRRVQEIAELLRIADLLERSPWSLSGGEQQRVALGRALVLRPRLLLLD
jgi:ABC-type sugar transport system ATPase subunit